MHSYSHHHATPAVHVKRYITRCTFFLTLETTRAFIIKKVRKRPNRLPTQDVPPIPAAPNSTVEKPGASGRSMPPPLTPRSKREKTVLLPAAARRRFARAPLPAKGTTPVTFRGAATPEDTGSQLSWDARHTDRQTATKRPFFCLAMELVGGFFRCRRCPPPCRRRRPRRRFPSHGPRRTRNRSRRPRRRRSCPSR